MENEINAQSVKLPSLGRLYEESHPLYNVESVELKPMTTYEEDILTSSNLIKKGTVINTLIKSCLVNKSIEPDNMYVFDRNTLLIALRVMSYGEEYNVRLECPNISCENKFNHSFNLKELPIKYIDSSLLVDKNNEFSFILPLSKDIIKFKFLTGKDEYDIIQTIKASKRNSVTISDITNSVSLRWIKQIKQIGNDRDSSIVASRVRKMLAGDSAALRNYIESIMPGIDLDTTLNCPICGEEFNITIPMEAEFFWPRSQ
jgi:hypothetical protein